MDGSSFDKLARLAATGAPRRGVFRSGVALIVAGLGATSLLGVEDAAAKSCKQKCKKKDKAARRKCLKKCKDGTDPDPGLTGPTPAGACVNDNDCPTPGTLAPCQVVRCTNGICGIELASAGTLCRPVAGACDVAEVCTGTSPECPADAFRPAGFVCRPVAGDCDLEEVCSGTSPQCPADQFKPNTVECRPAAGVCDVAEFCTGSSAACPANQFRDSSFECDDGKFCTGGGPACPA